MITERTLKKWRKEALIEFEADPVEYDETISYVKELQSRILRMTQEMLDMHLLRKK